MKQNQQKTNHLETHQKWYICTASGRPITILAPKKLLPKNDRNAANPRLGSPAQIRMAKDKEFPPIPSEEKKPMIQVLRSPGISPREQYH